MHTVNWLALPVASIRDPHTVPTWPKARHVVAKEGHAAPAESRPVDWPECCAEKT